MTTETETTALFTYPNFGRPDGFPEHTAHSGQRVRVLRKLTPEENETEEDMYEVRAEDGWTGTACASELTFTPGWADGEPFKIGSFDLFAWVEDFRSHFYHEGKAAEMLNRRYTGWYLEDGYSDEVAVAVVLEERGGEAYSDDTGIFHAAILDPVNEGAAMVSIETFDDRMEAAHAADSNAEHYAENERDYRAASNAGYRVADELRMQQDVRDDLAGMEDRPVRHAAIELLNKELAELRQLVQTDRWRDPSVFDDVFHEEYGKPFTDDLLQPLTMEGS